MNHSESFKRNVAIVAAVVSALAVSVYYLPFVSVMNIWGVEFELSVFKMFDNGTGKVLSVLGTVVLLVNTVVQTSKPKAWLVFVCALLTVLPVLMVNDDNMFIRVHCYVGYYLAIFVTIALFVCWLIEYVIYIRHMKHAGIMAIVGAAFVILGIVGVYIYRPLTILYLVIFEPLGFCMLFTALLGKIFSKKGGSPEVEDTVSDTEAITVQTASAPEHEEDAPEKDNSWKRWLIFGGIAISVAVAVILLMKFYVGDTESKPYIVNSPEAVIYDSTDGFVGRDSVKTISKDDYVSVVEIDADSVWAKVRYYKPLETNSVFYGYVRLENLITLEEYNKRREGISTETSGTDEPLVTSATDEEPEAMPETYDSQDDVVEDEPAGEEYTHSYKGTVDDKYAIEMTLTSDGGAYYTGEYFYTKNKTPIQLRGQLTDDIKHLVLEEYEGMNMIGKFEGTLSDNGYSGTWTSADGNTSYPFSVTVK
ncbi:hypothetical protein [Xylanibacter muris]|uniref:SH3 domain-containing protein n=2 Tax=Xylanibacter muris TaxID=2736290 RepID=A0ABX2AML5_9BACT|nr:hypothetical protein [Xylanibacter muris]NPD91469.1 hypothetical protein [Xylanibacter muris]